MKKNILFVLLFFSFSLRAQVWKPIETTCDNYHRSIAEDTLNRSISELEALPDSEALAYVGERIQRFYDLYGSFIIFMAPSLHIADKVVRGNYLYILEKDCKTTTADTSMVNLLKEMKSCGEKLMSEPNTKAFSATQHQDKFDVMRVVDQRRLLEVQKWLQENIKLPVQGIFNRFGGIMQGLAPRGYMAMTHETYKLSFDPELTALSKKLFYFLIERMIKAHELKTVGDSDIFSDLTGFFRTQGYDEHRARDLSFYYLGVYSTRGASIYSHLHDLYPSSWLALHALSMAISYLDKIAQVEGKNYILPKSISAKCHLGKPYHFWLAAYQTHYLNHQGLLALESYFYPIMGGIGYDFIMTENGRDLDKLFEIKTPYDEYANGTRFDNWARALGAHFGRHGGKILPISGDKLLEDNFALGKMPSKIPKTNQEKLVEYFRVVNPLPMILRLSL